MVRLMRNFTTLTASYAGDRVIPLFSTEFSYQSGVDNAAVCPQTQSAFVLRQAIIHVFFRNIYPQFPYFASCQYSCWDSHPTLYNSRYSNPSKGTNDVNYGLFTIMNNPNGAEAGQLYLQNQMSLEREDFMSRVVGWKPETFVIVDRYQNIIFRSDDYESGVSNGYTPTVYGSCQTITLKYALYTPLLVSGTVTVNLNGNTYTVVLEGTDTSAMVLTKFKTALNGVCVVRLVSSHLVFDPIGITTLPVFSLTSGSSALLEVLGYRDAGFTTSTQSAYYPVGTYDWLYDQAEGTFTEAVWGLQGSSLTSIVRTTKDPLWNSTIYYFCKDTLNDDKICVIAFRFAQWMFEQGNTSNIPMWDRHMAIAEPTIDLNALAQELYPTHTIPNTVRVERVGELPRPFVLEI
jgi:hypothetical protein